jgi:hypothetical protein
MTLRHAVGLAARILLLLVLAASGSYVLIYLARWEWVRAQIAGVFFLAALVMLATDLMLRRIAAVGSTTASDTASDPTSPSAPFPWLDAPGSTHVFLPILLGFGALLTLVAAAVERVVGWATGAPAGPSLRTGPAPWPMRLAVAALAVAAAAAMLLAAVTLMTRPDTDTPGIRRYTLAVASNEALFSPAESVATLAQVCRDRADLPGLTTTVTALPGDQVELSLTPIPGPFSSARFDGCLSDLLLDHRKFDIVGSTDQPS